MLFFKIHFFIQTKRKVIRCVRKYALFDMAIFTSFQQKKNRHAQTIACSTVSTCSLFSAYRYVTSRRECPYRKCLAARTKYQYLNIIRVSLLSRDEKEIKKRRDKDRKCKKVRQKFYSWGLSVDEGVGWPVQPTTGGDGFNRSILRVPRRGASECGTATAQP